MSLSLWAQDGVFDTDALELLVQTKLSVNSRRGKGGYSLLDLFDAAIGFSERGALLGTASQFIQSDGIRPRERDTRWDITLTDVWVEKMANVNAAFRDAVEIARRVPEMNSKCKNSKINIVWHAMIVFPGSPDQPLHIDDAQSTKAGRRCYFTLIVPLTYDPKAGGTHFPKLQRTFSSFGGALAFDGGVEHAGLGNRSKKDRIFLYAAIFTGKDHN
jgi:hypothetical protein